MEALSVFRKHLDELAEPEKEQLLPVLPVVTSAVVTAQPSSLKAVTSVTSVTSKKDKVQIKIKIKIFIYKVTDTPEANLTVITRGLNLSEAVDMLELKYGSRLLDVREK